MPDDDLDFEMNRPFISTVSNGGPHDDASYKAGFQMGQLDIVLGIPYMQFYGIKTYTTNVKQADLIAMHHGFEMEIEEEEGEWTTLTFSQICTCGDIPDDV